MKQKGFAPIYILIGILVIALIAGGSYYLGKTQILKPQPLVPGVVSKIPQPTAIPQTTESVSQSIESTNPRKISLANGHLIFEIPSEVSVKKLTGFQFSASQGIWDLNVEIFSPESIRAGFVCPKDAFYYGKDILLAKKVPLLLKFEGDPRSAPVSYPISDHTEIGINGQQYCLTVDENVTGKRTQYYERNIFDSILENAQID